MLFLKKCLTIKQKKDFWARQGWALSGRKTCLMCGHVICLSFSLLHLSFEVRSIVEYKMWKAIIGLFGQIAHIVSASN